VNRLKHLALKGRTVIASIHQPSSDVFELFDFLNLLSNGKTIYFGPTSQAQEVRCRASAVLGFQGFRVLGF
jgi:ABC-type multidrug transport system ATPase subunit